MKTMNKNQEETKIKEVISQLDDIHLNQVTISADLCSLLLMNNIEKIISTKDGSKLMQNIIQKLDDGLIQNIYNEIESKIICIIKHPYANYYLQVLFLKLDIEQKSQIILSLLDNLETIIKCMISFRALICLLDIPITNEAQLKVISKLEKIDLEHFLCHTRYLKILEPLLSSFNEDNVGFILNFICNKLENILNSTKQGFYLIKKLIKYTQKESNLIKIINSFTDHIRFLINDDNGCLIITFLLKKILSNENLFLDIKNESQIEKSFSKQIKSLYKNENIKQSTQISEIPQNLENLKNNNINNFIETIISNIISSNNFTKSQKKIIDVVLTYSNQIFSLTVIRKLIISYELFELKSNIRLIFEFILLMNNSPIIVNEYFIKEMETMKRSTFKSIIECFISKQEFAKVKRLVFEDILITHFSKPSIKINSFKIKLNKNAFGILEEEEKLFYVENEKIFETKAFSSPNINKDHKTSQVYSKNQIKHNADFLNKSNHNESKISNQNNQILNQNMFLLNNAFMQKTNTPYIMFYQMNSPNPLFYPYSSQNGISLYNNMNYNQQIKFPNTNSFMNLNSNVQK